MTQDIAHEATDVDELEPTSTLALFEGDEGGLTLAQRRTLVALIKNRFISAVTHPAEWKALAANPRPLRSRLNDLFLDLVISTDHEVAYKRQVATETGGRFPTLLHDKAWGREETILLVFLRMRYRSERAAGADRVFVDRADIHEYVQQHRPASATDIAADTRRVERGIDAVFGSGLLIGRSDGDRFEISNAIEVLLPLPKLQQLLAWLQDETGAADESTDDQDGDGHAYEASEWAKKGPGAPDNEERSDSDGPPTTPVRGDSPDETDSNEARP